MTEQPWQLQIFAKSIKKKEKLRSAIFTTKREESLRIDYLPIFNLSSEHAFVVKISRVRKLVQSKSENT